MSIKLTDTQLLMLSAAARRNDRCLVAASNVKAAAAQKIAGKLIASGLVKEIKAKPGAPVWRRNDEAGQSYALKLTAVGAKAIAIDESAEPAHVGDEGDSREDVEQTASSSQQPLFLAHRELQLAHDLPQSLQGRFGFAPSAQDHEVVRIGYEASAKGSFEPEHLPSQREPAHVNVGQQG